MGFYSWKSVCCCRECGMIHLPISQYYVGIMDKAEAKEHLSVKSVQEYLKTISLIDTVIPIYDDIMTEVKKKPKKAKGKNYTVSLETDTDTVELDEIKL